MKVKQLPKVLCLHLKRFKYVEDLQRWVAAATSLQFHAITAAIFGCMHACFVVCMSHFHEILCFQHEKHAAAASLAFPYVDHMALWCRLRKLMYRVVFPFELKLCNTSEGCDKADAVYNLFAVVVHIGSGMNHGMPSCWTCAAHIPSASLQSLSVLLHLQ